MCTAGACALPSSFPPDQVCLPLARRGEASPTRKTVDKNDSYSTLKREASSEGIEFSVISTSLLDIEVCDETFGTFFA